VLELHAYRVIIPSRSRFRIRQKEIRQKEIEALGLEGQIAATA
jgi:hypothetical protein